MSSNFLLICTFLGCIACTGNSSVKALRSSTHPRTTLPKKQGALPPVSVEQIAKHVWMHTSHKHVEGFGAVLSHGLIIRRPETIFLIDTAWEDQQTEKILAWVRAALSAPIKVAVVTHAHSDKMGGVRALRDAGVETYATELSNTDAVKRGLTRTEHTLVLEENSISFAEGSIEVFFPGGGHTRDNIVVYAKDERVLFGGCLIRPGDSDTLGNTADADTAYWAEAVRAVANRYPEAEQVIPSHGPPGGPELLDHTIALVEKHLQNQ